MSKKKSRNKNRTGIAEIQSLHGKTIYLEFLLVINEIFRIQQLPRGKREYNTPILLKHFKKWPKFRDMPFYNPLILKMLAERFAQELEKLECK